MADQSERQPGFVNFLTKKDHFGFFYFVMIDILERIEIHAVALFEKCCECMEFFWQLLAIFSSLKGHVSRRRMSARRRTPGSGSSTRA
jgi:hypothetical protein